jgi:hypothetical protein
MLETESDVHFKGCWILLSPILQFKVYVSVTKLLLKFRILNGIKSDFLVVLLKEHLY